MSDALLDILDNLELPTGDALPEAVAQFLLGIRFSDAHKARYLALADRHNNEGLPPDELATLRAFVEVDGVLSLLKARARRSLLEQQPAA